MLKLTGSLLIILSGTGIGLKLSDNLAIQNDRLKKLKKLIIILRGEIKYNNTYISQAFCNVAEKISEPYNDFLLYISERLNENSGSAFIDIWREAVEIKLSDSLLNKKQLEKIEQLGETIGFLDKEMQLASFDLFIEQLDMEIAENDRKLKDNSKLYKCLGVMGGILVVLIIV